MKFQLSSNSAIFHIARLLLATLFIFSGLSKGVNPFGLSIQLGEYFNALNISFLTPLSPLFAVLLPAAETLLGFMLLFGLARRISAWALMLAMSFFTLLTLWISIANPVNDCGCFGDLLKISNTATFVKNLLFMIPTIVIFSLRNAEFKSKTNSIALWVVAIVLSFILPVYTTFNLPLIDATPFKIGVNIPHAMEIPADAQQSVQQTVLHYKNLQSGKIEQFSINDTTWQDNSKYEFMDAVNEVISQGYIPPIASFPMLDRNGNDMSAELLECDKLLIIAAVNVEDIEMQTIANLRNQDDVRVVILTSASLNALPADIEAYNSDYSLIRTMVQFPQGGALMLKNGTIVNKWTMTNLPNNVEL